MFLISRLVFGIGQMYLKWKIMWCSLATYSFTSLVGVKLWCPSFYQMRDEGKEVLTLSQTHVSWKKIHRCAEEPRVSKD